jgi:hypothetical protein
MLVEEQFQNCTNRTATFLLFKLEGRARGRKHESAEECLLSHSLSTRVLGIMRCSTPKFMRLLYCLSLESPHTLRAGQSCKRLLEAGREIR